MMDFIKKIRENVDAVRTVNSVSKKEKEDPIEKKKRQRDETKVTLIRFTYDKAQDCYIYNEDTKALMKDVPTTAVHVTGRKRTYFFTDLWDELTWPEMGQSAIHMYLWMINTKINPEAITEKKRPGSDIDMKKWLMYGAIGIVVLIVSWGFIPKG